MLAHHLAAPSWSTHSGLRYPALERLAWRLLLAGLTLHMLLSAYGLIHLGYPYEAPLRGPFPFKIHPGTYLVALALACALSSRGNPLAALGRATAAHPLLGVHLAVMVSCLVWVLLRHGTSGAAFIVDTHWLPALMGLVLMHFDDQRRAFLLKLLGVFIVSNALLALLEYGLTQRLVPLALLGDLSSFSGEEHFRSSAFLGHPLVSTKVTGMLLPLVLLLPMRAAWRWLHVALMILALLAFGGRAGLVFAVVIYGTWWLLHLLGKALRGRWTYLQLTGGSVMLLMSLAVLVAGVIVSGVGDRIFSSFYLDNSAGVRLRVWSAYDLVSAQDLWLGLSARDIDAVAIRLGLDPQYEAIENGWIVLSLQFGLIFFVLWLIGFMCLMVWLFRQAPALVAAGMVVYLLNASTTNSFASKTTTQGLMVVYVVSAAAQMRQLQRQRMAAHADAAAAADRAQAASRFGRNEGFLAPYSMGATQPSSRAAIRT